MDGGVAMGGGGNGGPGAGANAPAAGPDAPTAEDAHITVDHQDKREMIDLDGGSIVLARRSALAEESVPDGEQKSGDPDVSA